MPDPDKANTRSLDLFARLTPKDALEVSRIELAGRMAQQQVAGS